MCLIVPQIVLLNDNIDQISQRITRISNKKNSTWNSIEILYALSQLHENADKFVGRA